MASPPRVLQTLADRFDPAPFDAPAGRAVLRLRVEGEGDWDALVDGGDLALRARRATAGPTRGCPPTRRRGERSPMT